MATYTYSADLDLERGSHAVTAQVNNVWQIVSSPVQDFVMAYDLSEHRMDLYSDEVQLVAWNVQLQDAMLPDLPQLSFASASASALAGTVTCVVKDRGLYVFKFAIRYVDKGSDGTYTYRCEALEKEDLTTTKSILVRATTSLDLVHMAAPSLNVVGEALLTQVITEQAFENSTPLDIISQLLIINGCLGHIRNGRLYLLPISLASQTAKVAMARADADTTWSKDAATYDKVRVYYTIKQSPIPMSVLTNYDASNWTGTLVNKQLVDTSLLPAPSGAAYMLKATDNSSRAALSVPIANFDRFLVGWCPVSATTMTVTLQEDVSNYLTFTRAFGGGTGAGFIASGVSALDTATKSISCGTKFIVQLKGNTTSPCTWRLTLKTGATVVWQGSWQATLGMDNLLQADMPASWYEASTCDTIVLEFMGLYVVNNGYGVQVSQLTVTEYVQRSVATGQHVMLVSTQGYSGNMSKTADSTATLWCFKGDLGAAPSLASGEYYELTAADCMANIMRWGANAGELILSSETISVAVYVENGRIVAQAQQAVDSTYVYRGIASVSIGTVRTTLIVYKAVTDNALVWQKEAYAWGSTFNLWDQLDIPIAQMTRTGNPKTIVTIAVTCAGDYYLDSPRFLASNPTVRYVDVGTGAKMYEVRTGEFSSQAAAVAYATGLLAIVSQPKEQYVKRVSLGSNLAVGDVVDADGTNLVVFSAAYDGNTGMVTLAAGSQVTNTLEALKQTVRRVDALEKNIL